MFGINIPNQMPYANRNIPYLEVFNITVNQDTVDLAAGRRVVPNPGMFFVRIPQSIPTGTTETLPVRLSLNGKARNITFFNGTNVTVADLTGTGVIQVFNDVENNILQLLSTPTPATT
jgi:hypothetical protein